MVAEKDPYIQSAYKHLQVISQDKQKRLEYEAREKAVLDYNQSMYEAEQRGMERINKLHSLLLQGKRYDDLERSMSDAAFRQKLLAEYKI